MTSLTNLERLRSIRKLEERQSGILMESALAELGRVESALQSVRERNRRARELMISSVRAGEPIDRIAAIEEIATTDRLKHILTFKLETAEKQADRFRGEFLSKRIERRQVEALLDTAKARAELEAKRKSQTSMDEWHRIQLRGETKDL